jgi:hypothetical protein
MAGEDKGKVREVPRAGNGSGPKVNWDSSQMRSTYANVCNANCSREEVVLLFGINQAWTAAEGEVTVQLAERVILSPFAAKRLALLLNNVIQQYESRFGQLELTTQGATATEQR